MTDAHCRAIAITNTAIMTSLQPIPLAQPTLAILLHTFKETSCMICVTNCRAHCVAHPLNNQLKVEFAVAVNHRQASRSRGGGCGPHAT